MLPPDTFPFTTKLPPEVTLTTVFALRFADPGETFPFKVNIPLAAENVSKFAEPEPGPVKVVEDTVNPPAATLKPPPTVADVPPPTNDAVIAALVMRATSTFWSMVTVKLLA